MSGGGGGGSSWSGGVSLAKKAYTASAAVDPKRRAGAVAVMGYNRLSKGRGWAGEQAQDFDPTDSSALTPDMPEATTPPTMEDIAAKEPDKERRRKQRMAALMAQGRAGTILTGPGGTSANNTIGGGGKQLVGA